MSRHGITAWLPVLLALLIAGLTMWLTKAVEIRRSGAPESVRHDPDIVLESFTARQLGLDGKGRYTLVARKMVHFADDDSTELTGVTFNATEQQSPPMRIDSARARLTSKADEVFFHDRVVIVREPEGEVGQLTVETTFLHLWPDSGIAKTDQPVVLREGRNTVRAEAMEINNKTRVAQLTKARATYYASPRALQQ